MKGVVFTSFIEWTEERWSFEMSDKVITAADLPNGGAYTAVGTYDYNEILTLFGALSEASGEPFADLVVDFGRDLFGRLHTAHPWVDDGVEHLFDLLERLEEHIHVEVKKLYPEAELPRFESERDGDRSMTMIYSSHRPLGALAVGLIQGASDVYGLPVTIDSTDLPADDGYRVRFVVRAAA